MNTSQVTRCRVQAAATVARGLAVVALFATSMSCAAVYVPPVAHVPMLEKKGDVHIQAGGGWLAGQADAAYALTDEIAVRGTFQMKHYERDHYRYGSLGVGRYWVGKIHPSRRVSLNADIGVGRFNYREPWGRGFGVGGERILQGTAVRSAIQADAGVEEDYWGFAVGVRAAHVYADYDRADLALTRGPVIPGPGASNGVFVEPFAVVRTGSEHVKLEMQAALSRPVVGRGYLESNPFRWTMLLSTDF